MPKEKKISIVTKDTLWSPSFELWDAIKKSSIGKYNSISVYGFDGEKITKSNPVEFRISKYSIDQYLVYRVVEYKTRFEGVPRFFYRDISKLESEEILKDLDFCIGCHSFSPDGDSLMFSTRRKINGSGTVGVELSFADSDSLRVKDQYGGYGLTAGSMMSSWVPKQNKVLVGIRLATDTPRDLKFRYLSQYPITADFTPGVGDLHIAVYDYKKENLSLLKGASDPLIIEEYPEISPDEKYVMYEIQIPHPEYGEYAYDSDIYMVPFNNGLGGEAKKLEGASEEGVREYFARFSRDGKWVVFNRIEGYGDVFLENTDLYIVPAQGGTPRKLASNSDEMDSAVIWSSNSRWITFVSRRYYINESRLFISEIDENGNAYPAIKLPNTEQETGVGFQHPYYTNDKRALVKILKNFEKFSTELSDLYPPEPTNQ